MLKLEPGMLTGVNAIDTQHQELINRINAVTASGTQSATKEETEKTLKLLGDYIIEHFAAEEVLQQKSGYPKYAEHKQMHQFYIGEFKKLKAEYDKNGPSPAFTLQLSNSIINWIVRHIKNVDVELGKWIRSHG